MKEGDHQKRFHFQGLPLILKFPGNEKNRRRHFFDGGRSEGAGKRRISFNYEAFWREESVWQRCQSCLEEIEAHERECCRKDVNSLSKSFFSIERRRRLDRCGNDNLTIRSPARKVNLARSKHCTAYFPSLKAKSAIRHDVLKRISDSGRDFVVFHPGSGSLRFYPWSVEPNREIPFEAFQLFPQPRYETTIDEPILREIRERENTKNPSRPPSVWGIINRKKSEQGGRGGWERNALWKQYLQHFRVRGERQKEGIVRQQPHVIQKCIFTYIWPYIRAEPFSCQQKFTHSSRYSSRYLDRSTSLSLPSQACAGVHFIWRLDCSAAEDQFHSLVPLHMHALLGGCKKGKNVKGKRDDLLCHGRGHIQNIPALALVSNFTPTMALAPSSLALSLASSISSALFLLLVSNWDEKSNFSSHCSRALAYWLTFESIRFL